MILRIKLQQENRQLRDDLSCLREEMNEMEEKFEEQLRLALRDSEMSAQSMKSKDDRSVLYTVFYISYFVHYAI